MTGMSSMVSEQSSHLVTPVFSFTWEGKKKIMLGGNVLYVVRQPQH